MATETNVLIFEIRSTGFDSLSSKQKEATGYASKLDKASEAINATLKKQSDILERLGKAHNSTDQKIKKQVATVTQYSGKQAQVAKVTREVMTALKKQGQFYTELSRRVASHTDSVKRYQASQIAVSQIQKQGNDTIKHYRDGVLKAYSAQKKFTKSAEILADKERDLVRQFALETDAVKRDTLAKKVSTTTRKKLTEENKIAEAILRKQLSAEAYKQAITKKSNALAKQEAVLTRTKNAMIKEANAGLKKYNSTVRKAVQDTRAINNAYQKVIHTTKAKKLIDKTATNTLKKYNAQLKQVSASLRVTTSREKQRGLEVKQAALQTAKANLIMEHQVNKYKVLGERTRAISMGLKDAGSSLRMFGRTMTMYFTAPIMAGLAQGVKFAANIESQVKRFEILTGSLRRVKGAQEDYNQAMTDGARLFQQIIEFSARTPFQLPDLDRAAQTLLAFGSSMGTVMDELKMMGDIAQGDAEKLQRITNSFGKVRARGTAHMRELNRFIISGVPIFEELNKIIGSTGKELITAVRNNEITFDQISQAFKNMTSEGGKFHEMTEVISKTLEGRFSTAVDNLNLNLAKLVEDFTPMLKRILESFIDWSQAFRKMSSSAREQLVKLGLSVAAIGPVLTVLGGVVTTLGIAFATLGGPLTAVMALLGAGVLGATVSNAVKKYNELNRVAVELADNTKKLSEAQEWNKDLLPGLSEEMYNLAEAHDAYAVAVEHASKITMIKSLLEQESVLSATQEKMYTIVQEMKESGVAIAETFGEKFQAGLAKGAFDIAQFSSDVFGGEELIYQGYQTMFEDALTMSVGDMRGHMMKLIEDVPGAEAVVEKFFGTTDIGHIKEKLIKEADWNAFYDELGDIVGTSMDSFEEKVRKHWEETLEAFVSLDALKGVLGIDPTSLKRALETLLSNVGLDEIEGDLDSGLISIAAGLDRMRMSVGEFEESFAAYKKSALTTYLTDVFKDVPTTEIDAMAQRLSTALSKGGTAWQKEMEVFKSLGFTDDMLTPFQTLFEEINSLSEKTQTAVDAYFAKMEFLAVSRVKEIESQAEYENAIQAFLGIGDEKTRKKVYEDTLDSLADEIASFDLDMQEMAKIKTQYELVKGGELDLSAIQDQRHKAIIEILRGADTAYNELQRILAKEYRVSLFEAFLTGDIDSVTIARAEATLETALEKIAESTEKFSDKEIWGAIQTGVITGFEDLDPLLRQSIKDAQEYYDQIGTLKKKAKREESLFEAMLGTETDIEEALKDLKIEMLMEEYMKKMRGKFDITSLFEGADVVTDASTLDKAIAGMINEAENDRSIIALSEYLRSLMLDVDTSAFNIQFQKFFGEDSKKALKEYQEEIRLEGLFEDLNEASNTYINQFGTSANKALKTSSIAIMSGSKDITDMIDELAGKLGVGATQVSWLDETLTSSEINKLHEYLTVLEEIQNAMQVTVGDTLVDLMSKLGSTITDQLLPVMDALGQSLASNDWSTWTNSLKDAVNAVVQAIPTLMVQAGVQLIGIPGQQVFGASLIAAGLASQIGAGALSASFGSSGTSLPERTETTISASARGDVIKDGYIVSAPTLRSTAYGASMIGEAGDEAVLPLGRTSSGALGVQASGGSVNITVNNNSTARVETKETRNADGSRNIEFMIQDAVNKGFVTGAFDTGMRSAYGVNRRGRN